MNVPEASQEFDIVAASASKVVFSREGLLSKPAIDNQFRLTVLAVRRPSKSVREFLSRLCEAGSHDRPPPNEFKVDIQGKNRNLYFRMRGTDSTEYDTFYSSLQQELFDVGASILALARWRVDATGSHQPIQEVCSVYCSSDQKTYLELPRSGTALGEFPRDLILTDEQTQSVVDYFSEQRHEPMGHKLFREAWAARVRSPRSALLTGVAALEVGVKEAAADLMAETEWLLLNQGSPDILRILRDWLPTWNTRRTVGGTVVAPPKVWLDDVQKSISMRNRLAHTGAGKVKRETVYHALCSIRDVLSLLDYDRGDEWAMCHISRDMLQELPGIDMDMLAEMLSVEDKFRSQFARGVFQESDLPERID